MLWIIVLVLLICALGGGFGLHSGYYGAPVFGGGLGLVVLIVILFLLFGRG